MKIANDDDDDNDNDNDSSNVNETIKTFSFFYENILQAQK